MLLELLSLLFLVNFALPILVLIILGILQQLFGVRTKYKELLLYIFERGRERIIEKTKNDTKVDDDDDDDKDEEEVAGEMPSADFDLDNTYNLITSGIQAIVQDNVTQRFEAQELTSWNLLTRTNQGYEFISWRLTLIWVVGFYVRYCILLPIRIAILILGTVSMVLLNGIVGLVPPSFGGKTRSTLNHWACIISFRLLSRAFSAIVTFHGEEYRPAGNGICVANHTSPIDVIILSCDSTFSLIGQNHGGFLGMMQRALSRGSAHIWFDRSEMKDRKAVSSRLHSHTKDVQKPPILIFPEGTCINNSAVMQFKKGSFEVDTVFYPVAMKYDARFGDAFWNSGEYGMLHYFFRMMTSWAIVCDVWYLPPMRKKEGESSIDFSKRVKTEIVKKGGFVDMEWDGGLKRSFAKKEWMLEQQEKMAKKLTTEKNTFSRLLSDASKSN